MNINILFCGAIMNTLVSKFLTISLLFCLSALPVYAEYKGVSGKGLNFAVLDMKGQKATLKQWGPLHKYLEEKLGQKIKLTTIKNSGMVSCSKSFDLALTNPVNVVIFTDKGQHSPLVTLNHKKQGPQFAGVIIVHKDSPITDIKQLAGKQVAVVNMKRAAGGFLFQANELVKVGLDPKKDFKRFTSIQNQKGIVKRVLTKHVDAGFIRTGMIEDDLKDSGLNLSDLRVLNKQTEGLSFMRSTDIYPHWGMVASTKLPADVRAKIKTALLGIDPNSAVAKAGKMKGFVDAKDHSGVEKAMRILEVYKFKN